VSSFDFMMSVLMLSIIMMSVLMLSVIMLIVLRMIAYPVFFCLWQDWMKTQLESETSAAVC
jgi:hypothetical protein